MFWKIVLHLIVFIVGSAYSSVGVIGPAICVNFALPATNKLIRAGLLANGKAVKRKYTAPVVFWACVNAIVLLLIYLFLPRFLLTFCIAILWTILLGIGQTGANEANLQEYIQAIAIYAVSTDEETQTEIIDTVLRK